MFNETRDHHEKGSLSEEWDVYVLLIRSHNVETRVLDFYVKDTCIDVRLLTHDTGLGPYLWVVHGMSEIIDV